MNIRELGQYDVVVAGAGPAGFAAAVSAARAGAKTALLEKYGMAGGTLTVLGNNSVDEFINPHKSGDRQVIRGVAWEFVRRLADMGYAEIPDFDAPFRSHQQYGVKVNPAAAAKLMDDMLLESGAELFYSQPVVEVEAENGRISSVILSTKSGLGRVRGKFFIDTTGDGDLCTWAGADYEIGGEDGDIQPGTLRYYLSGGADAAAIARGNEIFRQEVVAGNLTEHELLYGADFASILHSGGDNRNHVFDLNSADSASRTRAEIASRRQILRIMDALARTQTGVQVSGLAPEVAPRESRRILCDGYLTAEDYISCRRAEDAVCYTYWFIDIHAAGEYRAQHVYLKGENTPSIPLSCLIPRGLKNVLVAGRCISGERAAVSAVRVKASCMAMGQAAGCAAALAVNADKAEIRDVSAADVRRALAASGAVVPGLNG